jgi:hypothetical protein
LQGEIRQLELQKAELRKELRTEYKDVEQKYFDATVKLKALEMAHTDLEVYAKALDK